MTGAVGAGVGGRTPRVSVVIPNYNGAGWIPGCLAGVAGQQFRDFEVTLVDNGSTDGSADLVRAVYPGARVVALGRNTGFAKAVNTGVLAARGEYVALLNTDTVVEPGWLAALVEGLDRSPREVAAVGSKMLSMDDPGRLDDAGDALSWTGAAEKVGHGEPAERFEEPREIFSPCAGAALYRRSFLESLGGFDERFFAYLEDVDLGLRGRVLGHRYRFEPAARVLHKGQGSALPRSTYVRLVTRNRVMLFAKSIPAALLLRHLPRLVYGQLYFLIAYRRPLDSAVGYLSLIPQIPHILRERQRMRRERRVGAAELDSMLTKTMSEPPLRQLLLGPWRRSRS